MGRKAYTLSEKKLEFKSAIFTLNTGLKNKGLHIEDVGNEIPGSVMVQDLARMQNTYMNKSGCDILMHSKEELAMLGPEYFTRFFPVEELSVIKPQLINFINQNDQSAIYSFFQRVRPSANHNYKWYLTSSKLYDNSHNSQVMHISVELGDTCYAAKKMTYMCDQNDFIQKHFVKFEALTSREKEIIKMIANDDSSYIISDKLFISHHTVNNHRKNILRKLQISTLSGLIKFAIAFDML